MSIRQLALFVHVMMVVVLVQSSPGWSGGPVHGAKGAAMGTAFAAVVDDPSAIAHNPAGLGFLEGTRIYSGITAVTHQTDFSAAEGSTESTEFQVFFPPHLYASSDLKTESVAVGLGIFSQFGIGGRKWPDDGPFRYLSTESYIATLAANPVVAWRPLPSLALSAGAVYLWTVNRMERKVDQSPMGAGDGTLRVDADGGGWGWTLGVLWKANEQLQIGAAYRSGIDVDLSGEVELEGIAPPLQPVFGGSGFTSPVTSQVSFPSIVTLGVAWQPTPRWTLSGEVEWIDWSTFDQQRIDVQQPIPAVGFGDIEIPLDWEDGWIFKLGVEYRLDERLALRGGYTFLTQLAPEATLAPANPDADQHYLSLGTGVTVDRLTIDLFFTVGLYVDRQVNNAITAGTYRTLSQGLGISVGWHF